MDKGATAMTEERLMFQALMGIDEARAVLAQCWEEERVSHARAVEVERALRLALAAAQELERRAAGVPAPRLGD